ncbi:MAG: hypothetical protein C5B48_02485 [Candidatus Rokuibacteriota bacterium]|nr:MAG: hypothetical protein C5B48_02485 [Candidatus Rokubacteria bacterium]
MVLAAALVITSDPGGARAQSQAGGLPTLADRVSILEGVATTLKSTVTTLQTQVKTLDSTVTTVQTTNADLQSALAAEVAARQAADDALRALVAQVALDRLKGDVDLTTRISNLEAEVGDLANSVTGKFFDVKTLGGLVNGALATVATLGPLPPGNYLVIGRASVQNFIHDTTWFCTLNDPTGNNIDDSVTSTQFLGFSGHQSSLTMAGIARLASSGSVRMECQTGESGSDLPSVHLLAVQVGSPG